MTEGPPTDPGEVEPWPERTSQDHVRHSLLVAMAAVPWVGGTGTEIMEWLVPSALEKRRAAWITALDGRLRSVEQFICDEDVFVTAVLNATRIALGTHYEEKLRLLAGCVASVAEGRGEDDFIGTRYLGFVDELSVEHFQVLHAIAEKTLIKGDQVVWRDVFDLLPSGFSDAIWYVVIEDLQDRHLIFTTGYNHDVPAENYIDSLINLRHEGVELLRFVELLTADNQVVDAD